MKNEFDFDQNKQGRSVLTGILVIGGAAILILLIAFFVMKYALRGLREEAKDSVSGKSAVAVTETIEQQEETLQQIQEIVEESLKKQEEETALEESVGESLESFEDISQTTFDSKLVGSDVSMQERVCLGIDVSKYQGVVDWKKVKESGVEFAMIRVGLRTLSGGEIIEDECARYNLQEATANGIKVGVYFFSTAINETEAIQEAEWVVNLIKQYQITYPVAFNCEGYGTEGNRQYGMTKEQRTNIARVFLNRIYDFGYTPMFYASRNEMEGSRDWDMESLSRSYLVWVSWYSETAFAQNVKPEYDGSYHMWQYTSQGSVDGVGTTVDKNVAYFGYDQVAAAHDAASPEQNIMGKLFTVLPVFCGWSVSNEHVLSSRSVFLRSISSFSMVR